MMGVRLSVGMAHITFEEKYPFFLVACTRLYDPLCPSVGRKHFAFFAVWRHFETARDLKRVGLVFPEGYYKLAFIKL